MYILITRLPILANFLVPDAAAAPAKMTMLGLNVVEQDSCFEELESATKCVAISAVLSSQAKTENEEHQNQSWRSLAMLLVKPIRESADLGRSRKVFLASLLLTGDSESFKR